MGADSVYLISDRKFAGADTLATSYVLSEAIKKIGNYDFIFAGRQAIDGDTAQVGPQTAEKLNIPQITYVEEILKVKKNKVTVRRKIDGGYEILEAKLPVLMTVLKDAADTRPFKAKRIMAYKNARSLTDLEGMADGNSLLYIDKLVHEYSERNLFIQTFTMDDLKLDVERCGVKGSPTKTGLGSLIDQLMADHIFG